MFEYHLIGVREVVCRVGAGDEMEGTDIKTAAVTLGLLGVHQRCLINLAVGAGIVGAGRGKVTPGVVPGWGN